ncbi:unnamed protein product, partial [Brassica rapa subsp. narinosa]
LIPSVHGKETSRSTGKAPAALFFDDTSGLNNARDNKMTVRAVKFPYLVQVKLKKANKLGE